MSARPNQGENNTMKIAATILTLIMLLIFQPLSAHTRLAASSPADGAEVKTLSEIRLDFSATVKLTAVRLEDAAGSEISLATIPGDPAETFAIAIGQSLAAGSYVIIWRSISGDGHIVSGEIRFSVTD
jgi:methionine-rich copper-binding protein CopC